MQPRRDPFPYIMGGVIGAMVAGLALVVFILASNKGQDNGGTTAPVATTVAGGVATVASAPTSAGGDPPRMDIVEFKKLYDDPAKRPLIIDVRGVDQFNAGHIKGSISFPEADVDARIQELPKLAAGRPIVAYCQ